MKKNCRYYLFMLCLPLLLLLTSCAGRAPDDQFRLAVAAPYVDEEVLVDYMATLPAAVNYRAFPYGGQDGADAMSAAMDMKLLAMVANHELDVMLCDLDYAAHCARGDFFYDLTEVFSPEELAPWEDRLLSFPLLDMDGKPTGEQTAVCGIDVSDSQVLNDLLVNADGIGVFLIGGTDDLPLAKEFFWAMAEAPGQP